MKRSPKLILLTLMCAFGSITAAKTLDWTGDDFFLRAQNMALSDVLHSLAENYNTPLIVDPVITATFSGTLNKSDPLDMLNRLTAQYNLLAYYDGNTLYIYPASHLQHRVIILNTLPANSLLRYLTQRGITATQSCRVTPVPGSNVLDVNGVPICMELITQYASMLDSEMTKRQDDSITVNVYPLKYATAIDDKYQYRDKTVTVPGIISVLRDMNGGASTSSTTSPNASGLPSFSVDPRQNAVIIRDKEANMPNYRKLITALDHRPQMIEISVSIIDVDAGEVKQLGIDWSAVVSLGGGALSFNSGQYDLRNGFSTVISNTPNFMVRLSALEKNAQAYVLSQPSVVTLNNIQAVLDKNITFYTKLQGDKVAKLESITTGSLLRVTPRLLNHKNRQEIMLNLNIQDGQQKASEVKDEPLPEVENSEIASQATLKVGQSLLLGGFKQDKQIQSQKKIPFLGDIPLLGRLFSTKQNGTASVIRLFLIKATVVDSDKFHGN